MIDFIELALCILQKYIAKRIRACFILLVYKQKKPRTQMQGFLKRVIRI